MSAIDILMHRRLTLLDPSSWTDRNDVHYIRAFATRQKIKTVFALCFTERSETFHHWRVFTEGGNGVCIEFDKAELLAQLADQECIKAAPVRYMTMASVHSLTQNTDNLPFLKRIPYSDEREFRIVAWDKESGSQYRHVSIELKCINRIILSPFLSEGLVETVKQTILSIGGFEGLRLESTGLVDSFSWKIATDQIDI